MVNCLHACSFDVCTSGNAFTSDISMKDTVFYSCSILSKSSLCILVKRLCLDVFLYVFAPAYTVTPATSLQLFHLVESFFVYVFAPAYTVTSATLMTDAVFFSSSYCNTASSIFTTFSICMYSYINQCLDVFRVLV